MKAADRKKLEAHGWSVGSAQDFLGLSNEENSYLFIKISLAHALAENRAKVGISQLELAKRMHSSQSRVAKMEAGDSSVSTDLLIKALLYLGLEPKDVGKCVSQPLKKAA